MRRSKRLPLEQLAPYLCEPPFPEPLDWRAIFGNDRPVEIEVGFGKGLFLLNSALQHPDINYFGIEIMRKYQLFTATRMAIRQLTNVRLAKADARYFMKLHVAPGSVRAIHVYFPDPWWKKRHHKRRLFTAEFVEACAVALQAGGEFRVATDVADYFAVMTELCAGQPNLQPMPADERRETPATEFLTNFERKAQLKGQQVHRASYRKSSSLTVCEPHPGMPDGPTPLAIS